MTPLHLYMGRWQITRKDAPAGSKPDDLKNDCAQLGRYFVCQQTVNGTPGNLLIVVAANTAGHYYTQNVTPQGRALGLGQLEISGDKWVFTSSWNQGSKTTRYRTTNTWNGKDRIHFEQQESDDDGKTWRTTSAGDEVRVGH